MPTTVKILFNGLALVFEEVDHWKVIFLCDKKHKLNFSHFKNYGSPSPPISLHTKGREISIKVEPSRPSVGVTTGDNYEKIFNISSLYAHRDGVNLRKPANMKKLDRVDLTIPYAKLFTETDTGVNYEIKKKGSTVNPTPLAPVAEIVGAEIKLNAGEKLLVIGKDALFPDLPEFPYDGNSIYTLSFDNDCGLDCDSSDDFGLYYDLIYDAKDPKLEFRAGRKGTVKDVLVDEDEESGAKEQYSEEPIRFLAPPDGNCDPISSFPPPGMEP
jgi:hypothetical protein